MERASLIELRRHLRDRFPAGRHEVAGSLAGGGSGAGATEDRPRLSAASFPAGTLSEVIPGPGGAGASLLIDALLARPAEAGEEAAGLRAEGFFPELGLVDASGCFDPQSHHPDLCARLLWLRCAALREALQGCDLLLRDGNLRLILLDLAEVSPRELRSLPGSIWYRFQRLLEDGGTALLCLTPEALIPGSALRLRLDCALSLDCFQYDRNTLVMNLRSQVLRSRRAVS